MRSHELRRTVTAVYVDSALHMVAVIGMDTALAVYAGAAIALVPVGGAREFMEENALPPVLAANATKICESLGDLLGDQSVRLYQTFMPGEHLPADAASQLLALGRRMDIELAVSGYGRGRLSVVLTS
jgi:hypothetical protein